MDGSILNGPRGGRAVGLLCDLGSVEAGAVMCLRLWCEGESSPARRSFEAETGPFGGHTAIGMIGAICALCQSHGRRPLMRHHLTCDCLGGDEACLAQLVEAALAGERNEAMMLASLMVRADHAPQVVDCALRAGVALKRLSLARPDDAGPSAPSIH